MILDNELMFSDAQAFSADAASTNYFDLRVAGRRLGAGVPLAIVLHVDVAADGTTTDETYSFNVRTDDNTGFSSPTTLGTNVRTFGNLTAGSQHVFILDPSWTFEQYVQIFFDGGGTTPTITGTLHLVPLSAVRSYKVYPNAYKMTH